MIACASPYGVQLFACGRIIPGGVWALDISMRDFAIIDLKASNAAPTARTMTTSTRWPTGELPAPSWSVRPGYSWASAS